MWPQRLTNISFYPITDPGNPGLKFVSNWAVQAGQGIDSNISYYVKVLPGGAPIIDVSALMAGAGTTKTALVTLAENVFDYTKPAPNGIATILLYINSSGMLLNEEIDFATNSYSGPLFVVKDIILTGNDGNWLTFIRRESVLGENT